MLLGADARVSFGLLALMAVQYGVTGLSVVATSWLKVRRTMARQTWLRVITSATVLLLAGFTALGLHAWGVAAVLAGQASILTVAAFVQLASPSRR